MTYLASVKSYNVNSYLSNNTDFTPESQRCSRCSGFGHISRYRHIQGGICFLCHGSGTTNHDASRYKNGYSDATEFTSRRKHLRRWYLGVICNEDECVELFSFTALSRVKASAMADKKLLELSLIDSKHEYQLLIGKEGEKRECLRKRVRAGAIRK